MTDNVLNERALIGAKVRVPDHVAYSDFDSETVLLNLSTGQYHGLNATGGRMLELLRQTGSVPQTAEIVAQEFDQPADEITGDLLDLCAELARRGLIEVDPSVE